MFYRISAYPYLGGCPRIKDLLWKTPYGHFLRSFSLNSTTIRLKWSKKLTQKGFPSLRFLFSDSLLGAELLIFTDTLLFINRRLNYQAHTNLRFDFNLTKLKYFARTRLWIYSGWFCAHSPCSWICYRTSYGTSATALVIAPCITLPPESNTAYLRNTTY